MKDGLETMLVLSGLECECLVCLFQVPDSAADPQSLNQPHSPGTPHSVPHVRNGTKDYCLNVMLLFLPKLPLARFSQKIFICKEEIGLSERVSLIGPHLGYIQHSCMRLAGGLPSFVIPLQESSQVIRTKGANTVSHSCDSPTLLDISLTTDAEDKR